QRSWIIHVTHKRGHDTSHALGLLRIEVVSRAPSAGLWGRRAPGWLGRNPGATCRQEEKQKGDATECGFQLIGPGRQRLIAPKHIHPSPSPCGPFFGGTPHYDPSRDDREGVSRPVVLSSASHTGDLGWGFCLHCPLDPVPPPH